MPSEVLTNSLFVVGICALRLRTDESPRRIAVSLIFIEPFLFTIRANWISQNSQRPKNLQRITERAFAVALPEVSKDDHAGDSSVSAPQRSEGIAFVRHHR